MTATTIIKEIKGREILDSRGNPTVEVEVHTETGFGRACVPSGASTGTKEAWEKRDGDKSRYAPPMSMTEEPLDAITEAITEAGHSEDEICLGMDAAASPFFDTKTKKYHIDGRDKDGDELIEFYQALVEKYPIELIEDPFEEDSFELFAELTAKMPRKIIVGDDLFVTNVRRLREGIKKKAANAVLLKWNQIGTVSETLDTVRLASENGYKKVVSHRSGET